MLARSALRVPSRAIARQSLGKTATVRLVHLPIHPLSPGREDNRLSSLGAIDFPAID
jgi:hypothetical protein